MSFNFYLSTKKAGGTLHFIDEIIDSGNIIKREEFEIKDTDTSISLFQKNTTSFIKCLL